MFVFLETPTWKRGFERSWKKSGRDAEPRPASALKHRRFYEGIQVALLEGVASNARSEEPHLDRRDRAPEARKIAPNELADSRVADQSCRSTHFQVSCDGISSAMVHVDR